MITKYIVMDIGMVAMDTLNYIARHTDIVTIDTVKNKKHLK